LSGKQGRAVNELRASSATNTHTAIDKYEALGLVCKRVVYPLSKAAQMRLKSRATVAIMPRYNTHNYSMDQFDIEPDDEVLLVILRMIARIMEVNHINKLSSSDLKEFFGISKANYLLMRLRLHSSSYWLTNYRVQFNMDDDSLHVWCLQSSDNNTVETRNGNACLRNFGGAFDQIARYIHETSDGVSTSSLRDAYGLSRKRSEKMFSYLLQDFNLRPITVQDGKSTFQRAVTFDYANKECSFDEVVDNLYGDKINTTTQRTNVVSVNLIDVGSCDEAITELFQHQNAKVSSQRLHRLNLIKEILQEVRRTTLDTHLQH
jgi:hypothetical protein